jgi:acetyltransferase-like isoleucine patch superfamily enzyme
LIADLAPSKLPYSSGPPMSAKLPPNPYHELAWIAGQPEIGEDCWIGAFTLIDGLGGLKIGRGCNISSGAQVLSHSTARRCVTERAYPGVDKRPTELGDWVFVGANAVILMGCRIGHHSIIGAGAVVAEDTVVPPYSLVVGVPARVARSIEAEIGQWRDAGARAAALAAGQS